MRKNWSKKEVEAIVEDYFDMLILELVGKKFNKSEHCRILIEQLNDRSRGSVEFKHQNISAILIEMGIPYISGYKPASNYEGNILPDVISDYISQNPQLNDVIQQDVDAPVKIPTVYDILAALEKSPKSPKRATGIRRSREPKLIYNPNKINYLEREAHNHALGNAGEQFVINFERARLIHAGKENLADEIEQVSATIGPVAGYDIRSFEEDGSDRYIEAKTTKYGKSTPFFVTQNELEFSNRNQNRYFLYRVFKYRTKPGLFTLHGFLQNTCIIEPSQYVAKPM